MVLGFLAMKRDVQIKKRPLRQDAAAGAGGGGTMQVAALRQAALAVCLFMV